jgi:hypothetical protein
MAKNLEGKEFQVRKLFRLLGNNWARKNNKLVRREYAALWFSLSKDEKDIARKLGYWRPSWVSDEHDRRKKAQNRRRREERAQCQTAS